MLFPLLFFMFIGAFDLGFFCYSPITLQNAARVAALYASASPGTNATNSTSALHVLLNELHMMPNYSSLPTACGASPLPMSAKLDKTAAAVNALAAWSASWSGAGIGVAVIDSGMTQDPNPIRLGLPPSRQPQTRIQ